MKARTRKIRKLALFLASSLALHGSAIGSDRIRLSGHVPLAQIKQARHLGRLAARSPVRLAFTLKPRDPIGLADLARRLYEPNDPAYGHYLSSAEFKERFAPSEADIRDVLNYLHSNGFRSINVHANNLVIDASADASAVETAFQIELHEYVTPAGRHVRAPLQEPELREDIASRLHGVTGLSSFQRSHPHLASRTPHGINSINAYMTPPKIKIAYNFSQSATAGAGETIALFELDGFRASDLTTYENTFSIPPVAVNTILVDGVSGVPGADADEVTLDIELTAAVSPGSNINVYEGPNTDSGVIDTYSRIATDNSAKVVSTSWGSPEDGSTQSFLDSENAIFQQMAVQGQSVFAASGDAGAYDNTNESSLLTVDDPASQPYVTAVGGTTLNLVAGTYGSESSWGTPASAQGGGGGFSAVWSMPSWQTGLATSANKGSNSRRMVPDIAFDANPATGYAICLGGSWYAMGGTSAAAPLWAAFVAQVNQARVAANLPRLGFANPAIYQVAQSSLNGSAFHDVADGSTNLFFPATSGFDLSTGWGSPRGSPLLAALSAASLPPYPPASVSTSGSAGLVTISWSAVTGATSYTVYRSASFNGPYVSVSSGSTATSLTQTVGGNGFYYYITATNAAGTSGPSAKRAGAAPLAAPGAATGLSTGSGQ